MHIINLTILEILFEFSTKFSFLTAGENPILKICLKKTNLD